MATVVFLLLWQSVYRISNAAINNLLAILSKFVRVFGSGLTHIDPHIDVFFFKRS